MNSDENLTGDWEARHLEVAGHINNGPGIVEVVIYETKAMPRAKAAKVTATAQKKITAAILGKP